MSGDYRETELGVRGSAAAVEKAALWLTAELDRAGLHWERRAASRAEGAA